MEWVDDFLDAVDKGFRDMDLSTFEPINCLDIFPLYAKEGVRRILRIIENTSSYDMKDLAKRMPSPSVIRVEVFLALIKARLAGVEKEKLIKIAEFYNSLLRSWCLEDYYAKEGKNIVHTKEEIKQFVKNLKTAGPEIAKELGKLSNACYHLAYGLYSDNNPQICYENFGPYDVSEEFGEGYILVIKQFQNLKPLDLWGSRVEDLSCGKVKIYCVYKDVKFSIDAATHTNYEGDVIKGLKYFAVEIDERLVDGLSEIRKVTEEIGLKAIEMWEELTSLDFEKMKVKYLEQRCYNYINLCKKLGLDWKPSLEMLEAVKGKELVKDFWPEFSVPEDEIKFWREMCDPRVDSGLFL